MGVSRFLKTMALTLAMVLIVQDISWAAASFEGKTVSVRSGTDPAILPQRSSLKSLLVDPSAIQLPVGAVQLKEARLGTNGRLIVLIEDPHGNYGGQKNIAATIRTLAATYGIRTVLLEGGTRRADLGTVGSAADKRQLTLGAEQLLREGILSGPEHVSLTASADVELHGVENARHYGAALLAYARVASARDAAGRELHEIRNALQILKERIYPQTLLEYEAAHRQEDDGTSVGALDRMLRLAAEARVSLNPYPTLLRLKTLKWADASVDHRALAQEQESLLAILHAGSRAAEAAAAAKDLGRTAHPAEQERLIRTLLGMIETSDPSGASNYPHLRRYADHLRSFRDLDWEALAAESEELEARSYRQLLQDPDARRIALLGIYFDLIQKAFDLRLTSREFAQLQFNRKHFESGEWKSFLRKKSEQMGIVDLRIPHTDVLKSAWPLVRAFYTLVNLRDRSLADRAGRTLAASGQKAAVLVAGGYHTDHLKELLAREGYGWAVLTPQVRTETDHAQYEKILLTPLRREVPASRTAPASVSADPGQISKAPISEMNGLDSTVAARLASPIVPEAQILSALDRLRRPQPAERERTIDALTARGYWSSDMPEDERDARRGSMSSEQFDRALQILYALNLIRKGALLPEDESSTPLLDDPSFLYALSGQSEAVLIESVRSVPAYSALMNVIWLVNTMTGRTLDALFLEGGAFVFDRELVRKTVLTQPEFKNSADYPDAIRLSRYESGLDFILLKDIAKSRGYWHRAVQPATAEQLQIGQSLAALKEQMEAGKRIGRYRPSPIGDMAFPTAREVQDAEPSIRSYLDALVYFGHSMPRIWIFDDQDGPAAEDKRRMTQDLSKEYGADFRYVGLDEKTRLVRALARNGSLAGAGLSESELWERYFAPKVLGSNRNFAHLYLSGGVYSSMDDDSYSQTTLPIQLTRHDTYASVLLPQMDLYKYFSSAYPISSRNAGSHAGFMMDVMQNGSGRETVALLTRSVTLASIAQMPDAFQAHAKVVEQIISSEQTSKKMITGEKKTAVDYGRNFHYSGTETIPVPVDAYGAHSQMIRTPADRIPGLHLQSLNDDLWPSEEPGTGTQPCELVMSHTNLNGAGSIHHDIGHFLASKDSSGLRGRWTRAGYTGYQVNLIADRSPAVSTTTMITLDASRAQGLIGIGELDSRQLAAHYPTGSGSVGIPRLSLDHRPRKYAIRHAHVEALDTDLMIRKFFLLSAVGEGVRVWDKTYSHAHGKRLLATDVQSMAFRLRDLIKTLPAIPPSASQQITDRQLAVKLMASLARYFRVPSIPGPVDLINAETLRYRNEEKIHKRAIEKRSSNKKIRPASPRKSDLLKAIDRRREPTHMEFAEALLEHPAIDQKIEEILQAAEQQQNRIAADAPLVHAAVAELKKHGGLAVQVFQDGARMANLEGELARLQNVLSENLRNTILSPEQQSRIENRLSSALRMFGDLQILLDDWAYAASKVREMMVETRQAVEDFRAGNLSRALARLAVVVGMMHITTKYLKESNRSAAGQVNQQANSYVADALKVFGLEIHSQEYDSAEGARMAAAGDPAQAMSRLKDRVDALRIALEAADAAEPEGQGAAMEQVETQMNLLETEASPFKNSEMMLGALEHIRLEQVYDPEDLDRALRLIEMGLNPAQPSQAAAWYVEKKTPATASAQTDAAPTGMPRRSFFSVGALPFLGGAKQKIDALPASSPAAARVNKLAAKLMGRYQAFLAMIEEDRTEELDEKEPMKEILRLRNQYLTSTDRPDPAVEDLFREADDGLIASLQERLKADPTLEDWTNEHVEEALVGLRDPELVPLWRNTRRKLRLLTDLKVEPNDFAQAQAAGVRSEEDYARYALHRYFLPQLKSRAAAVVANLRSEGVEIHERELRSELREAAKKFETGIAEEDYEDFDATDVDDYERHWTYDRRQREIVRRAEQLLRKEYSEEFAGVEASRSFEDFRTDAFRSPDRRRIGLDSLNETWGFYAEYLERQAKEYWFGKWAGRIRELTGDASDEVLGRMRLNPNAENLAAWQLTDLKRGNIDQAIQAELRKWADTKEGEARHLRQVMTDVEKASPALVESVEPARPSVSVHHLIDRLPAQLTQPLLVLESGAHADRAAIAQARPDLTILAPDRIEAVLPYADRSVGFIYARLVLNDLDRQQTARLFSEFRRVLVPGGSLLVAVESAMSYGPKQPDAVLDSATLLTTFHDPQRAYRKTSRQFFTPLSLRNYAAAEFLVLSGESSTWEHFEGGSLPGDQLRAFVTLIATKPRSIVSLAEALTSLGARMSGIQRTHGIQWKSNELERLNVDFPPISGLREPLAFYGVHTEAAWRSIHKYVSEAGELVDIVDVGSGNGVLGIWALKRFPTVKKVISIEQTSYSVREHQKLLMKNDIAFTKIMGGSGEADRIRIRAEMAAALAAEPRAILFEGNYEDYLDALAEGEPADYWGRTLPDGQRTIPIVVSNLGWRSNAEFLDRMGSQTRTWTDAAKPTLILSGNGSISPEDEAKADIERTFRPLLDPDYGSEAYFMSGNYWGREIRSFVVAYRPMFASAKTASAYMIHQRSQMRYEKIMNLLTAEERKLFFQAESVLDSGDAFAIVGWISRVEAEVLPALKRAGSLWARQLDRADRWLAFHTMYHMNDQDHYERRLHTLATVASDETLAWRAAFFGPHLRRNRTRFDDQDLIGLKLFLSRSIPSLAVLENKTRDSADEALYRRRQRWLLNSLVFPYPAGTDAQFHQTELKDLLDEVTKSSGTDIRTLIRSAWYALPENERGFLMERPFFFTEEYLIQLLKDERNAELTLSAIAAGEPESEPFNLRHRDAADGGVTLALAVDALNALLAEVGLPTVSGPGARMASGGEDLVERLKSANLSKRARLEIEKKDRALAGRILSLPDPNQESVGKAVQGRGFNRQDVTAVLKVLQAMRPDRGPATVEAADTDLARFDRLVKPALDALNRKLGSRGQSLPVAELTGPESEFMRGMNAFDPAFEEAFRAGYLQLFEPSVQIIRWPELSAFAANFLAPWLIGRDRGVYVRIESYGRFPEVETHSIVRKEERPLPRGGTLPVVYYSDPRPESFEATTLSDFIAVRENPSPSNESEYRALQRIGSSGRVPPNLNPDPHVHLAIQTYGRDPNPQSAHRRYLRDVVLPEEIAHAEALRFAESVNPAIRDYDGSVGEAAILLKRETSIDFVTEFFRIVGSTDEAVAAFVERTQHAPSQDHDVRKAYLVSAAVIELEAWIRSLILSDDPVLALYTKYNMPSTGATPHGIARQVFGQLFVRLKAQIDPHVRLPGHGRTTQPASHAQLSAVIKQQAELVYGELFHSPQGQAGARMANRKAVLENRARLRALLEGDRPSAREAAGIYKTLFNSLVFAGSRNGETYRFAGTLALFAPKLNFDIVRSGQTVGKLQMNVAVQGNSLIIEPSIYIDSVEDQNQGLGSAIMRILKISRPRNAQLTLVSEALNLPTLVKLYDLLPAGVKAQNPVMTQRAEDLIRSGILERDYKDLQSEGMDDFKFTQALLSAFRENPGLMETFTPQMLAQTKNGRLLSRFSDNAVLSVKNEMGQTIVMVNRSGSAGARMAAVLADLDRLQAAMWKRYWMEQGRTNEDAGAADAEAVKNEYRNVYRNAFDRLPRDVQQLLEANQDDEYLRLYAHDPLGALSAIQHEVLENGLTDPKIFDRMEEILALYNRMSGKGPISLALSFVESFASFYKEGDQEKAYIRLTQRLEGLPARYRYWAVAMSLLFVAFHSRSGLAPSEELDLLPYLPNLEFCVRELKQGISPEQIPSEEERRLITSALKQGLTQFTLSMVSLVGNSHELNQLKKLNWTLVHEGEGFEKWSSIPEFRTFLGTNAEFLSGLLDEMESRDASHGVSLVHQGWTWFRYVYRHLPIFKDGSGKPLLIERILLDPYSPTHKELMPWAMAHVREADFMGRQGADFEKSKNYQRAVRHAWRMSVRKMSDAGRIRATYALARKIILRIQMTQDASARMTHPIGSRAEVYNGIFDLDPHIRRKMAWEWTADSDTDVEMAQKLDFITSLRLPVPFDTEAILEAHSKHPDFDREGGIANARAATIFSISEWLSPERRPALEQDEVRSEKELIRKKLIQDGEWIRFSSSERGRTSLRLAGQLELWRDVYRPWIAANPDDFWFGPLSIDRTLSLQELFILQRWWQSDLEIVVSEGASAGFAQKYPYLAPLGHDTLASINRTVADKLKDSFKFVDESFDAFVQLLLDAQDHFDHGIAMRTAREETVSVVLSRRAEAEGARMAQEDGSGVSRREFLEQTLDAAKLALVQNDPLFAQALQSIASSAPPVQTAVTSVARKIHPDLGLSAVRRLVMRELASQTSAQLSVATDDMHDAIHMEYDLMDEMSEGLAPFVRRVFDREYKNYLKKAVIARNAGVSEIRSGSESWREFVHDAYRWKPPADRSQEATDEWLVHQVERYTWGRVDEELGDAWMIDGKDGRSRAIISKFVATGRKLAKLPPRLRKGVMRQMVRSGTIEPYDFDKNLVAELERRKGAVMRFRMSDAWKRLGGRAQYERMEEQARTLKGIDAAIRRHDPDRVPHADLPMVKEQRRIANRSSFVLWRTMTNLQNHLHHKDKNIAKLARNLMKPFYADAIRQEDLDWLVRYGLGEVRSCDPLIVRRLIDGVTQLARVAEQSEEPLSGNVLRSANQILKDLGALLASSDGARMATLYFEGEPYVYHDSGAQGSVYVNRAKGLAIKIFDRMPGVSTQVLDRVVEINGGLKRHGLDVVEMLGVIEVRIATGETAPAIWMRYVEGEPLEDLYEQLIRSSASDAGTAIGLASRAESLLDEIDGLTGGLADRRFAAGLDARSDFSNFIQPTGSGAVNVDPLEVGALRLGMDRESQGNRQSLRRLREPQRVGDLWEAAYELSFPLAGKPDERIVFYVDYPDGEGPFPAAFAVHGWQSSASEPLIAELARAVAGRGFAVVRPDLRGHRGRVWDETTRTSVDNRNASSGDVSTFTWGDSIDDLHRILSSLRTAQPGTYPRMDLERTFWFGHSYGGWTVERIASLAAGGNDPRFAGLKIGAVFGMASPLDPARALFQIIRNGAFARSIAGTVPDYRLEQKWREWRTAARAPIGKWQGFKPWFAQTGEWVNDPFDDSFMQEIPHHYIVGQMDNLMFLGAPILSIFYAMYARFLNLHAPASLTIVSGMGHFFEKKYRTVVIQRILDRLDASMQPDGESEVPAVEILNIDPEGPSNDGLDALFPMQTNHDRTSALVIASVAQFFDDHPHFIPTHPGSRSPESTSRTRFLVGDDGSIQVRGGEGVRKIGHLELLAEPDRTARIRLESGEGDRAAIWGVSYPLLRLALASEGWHLEEPDEFHKALDRPDLCFVTRFAPEGTPETIHLKYTAKGVPYMIRLQTGEGGHGSDRAVNTHYRMEVIRDPSGPLDAGDYAGGLSVTTASDGTLQDYDIDISRKRTRRFPWLEGFLSDWLRSQQSRSFDWFNPDLTSSTEGARMADRKSVELFIGRALKLAGWVGVVYMAVNALSGLNPQVYREYVWGWSNGIPTLLKGWSLLALIIFASRFSSRWMQVAVVGAPIGFMLASGLDYINPHNVGRALARVGAVFVTIVAAKTMRREGSIAERVSSASGWALSSGLIGSFHQYTVWLPFVLKTIPDPAYRSAFDIGIATNLVHAPLSLTMAFVFGERMNLWREFRQQGLVGWIHNPKVRLAFAMLPYNFCYWYPVSRLAYRSDNPWNFFIVSSIASAVWTWFMSSKITQIASETQTGRLPQSERKGEVEPVQKNPQDESGARLALENHESTSNDPAGTTSVLGLHELNLISLTLTSPISTREFGALLVERAKREGITLNFIHGSPALFTRTMWKMAADERRKRRWSGAAQYALMSLGPIIPRQVTTYYFGDGSGVSRMNVISRFGISYFDFINAALLALNVFSAQYVNAAITGAYFAVIVMAVWYSNKDNVELHELMHVYQHLITHRMASLRRLSAMDVINDPDKREFMETSLVRFRGVKHVTPAQLAEFERDFVSRILQTGSAPESSKRDGSGARMAEDQQAGSFFIRLVALSMEAFLATYIFYLEQHSLWVGTAYFIGANIFYIVAAGMFKRAHPNFFKGFDRAFFSIPSWVDSKLNLGALIFGDESVKVDLVPYARSVLSWLKDGEREFLKNHGVRKFLLEEAQDSAFTRILNNLINPQLEKLGDPDLRNDLIDQIDILLQESGPGARMASERQKTLDRLRNVGRRLERLAEVLGFGKDHPEIQRFEDEMDRLSQAGDKDAYRRRARELYDEISSRHTPAFRTAQNFVFFSKFIRGLEMRLLLRETGNPAASSKFEWPEDEKARARHTLLAAKQFVGRIAFSIDWWGDLLKDANLSALPDPMPEHVVLNAGELKAVLRAIESEKMTLVSFIKSLEWIDHTLTDVLEGIYQDGPDFGGSGARLAQSKFAVVKEHPEAAALKMAGALRAAMAANTDPVEFFSLRGWMVFHPDGTASAVFQPVRDSSGYTPAHERLKEGFVEDYADQAILEGAWVKLAIIFRDGKPAGVSLMDFDKDKKESFVQASFLMEDLLRTAFGDQEAREVYSYVPMAEFLDEEYEKVLRPLADQNGTSRSTLSIINQTLRKAAENVQSEPGSESSKRDGLGARLADRPDDAGTPSPQDPEGRVSVSGSGGRIGVEAQLRYWYAQPGDFVGYEMDITGYLGSKSRKEAKIHWNFLLPNGRPLKRRVAMGIGGGAGVLKYTVQPIREGGALYLVFRGYRKAESRQEARSGVFRWDAAGQTIRHTRDLMDEWLAGQYRRKGDFKSEEKPINRYIGQSSVDMATVSKRFLLPNGRRWGHQDPMRLGLRGLPLYTVHVQRVAGQLQIVFRGYRDPHGRRPVASAVWDWVSEEGKFVETHDRWLSRQYARSGVFSTEDFVINDYMGLSGVRLGVLNKAFLLPNGKTLGYHPNLRLNRKSERFDRFTVRVQRNSDSGPLELVFKGWKLDAIGWNSTAQSEWVWNPKTEKLDFRSRSEGARLATVWKKSSWTDWLGLDIRQLWTPGVAWARENRDVSSERRVFAALMENRDEPVRAVIGRGVFGDDGRMEELKAELKSAAAWLAEAGVYLEFEDMPEISREGPANARTAELKTDAWKLGKGITGMTTMKNPPLLAIMLLALLARTEFVDLPMLLEKYGAEWTTLFGAAVTLGTLILFRSVPSRLKNRLTFRRFKVLATRTATELLTRTRIALQALAQSA